MHGPTPEEIQEAEDYEDERCAMEAARLAEEEDGGSGDGYGGGGNLYGHMGDDKSGGEGGGDEDGDGDTAAGHHAARPPGGPRRRTRAPPVKVTEKINARLLKNAVYNEPNYSSQDAIELVDKANQTKKRTG